MTNENKKILKEIYKKRPANARKYDYGYLIVIGGSELYTGAPALGAFAAQAAGIDMVCVLAPERAADTIAGFSPNIATLPLEGKRLEKKHLDILIEETQAVKTVSRQNCAVLIGGGIGRSPETQDTVIEYLRTLEAPAVVDAEGIYAVAKEPQVVSDKKLLLTPHAHEFFLLTGKKIDGLTLNQTSNLVKQEAKKLNTSILLKGAADIISDGKKIAVSSTGNALMTKGGLGDTLAGIAAALMARGIDPFTAGIAAAYINGLAGELAGKRLGESICATDLIKEIPNILPKLKY